MQVTDPSRADEAGSPTGDGELATELFAVISYVHQHCTADLIAAFGELDLTMTQVKLMQQLAAKRGELTLKQSAESVHISLPAASRAVDELVRRALVTRHEDAFDRRAKRIALTGAGTAILHRLSEARLSGLESFTAGLTTPERELLGQAARKLLERPEVAAHLPDVEARRS